MGGAANDVALDQGDMGTEPGRMSCRRVARWPAANESQIELTQSLRLPGSKIFVGYGSPPTDQASSAKSLPAGLSSQRLSAVV